MGARIRTAFGYRDTRLLVTLFLLAQVLDAVTTAFALGTGRFREGNPLLVGSVTSYPYVTYGAKFAVATIVAVTVVALRLRWRLRRTVLVVFTLISLAAPLANLLRVAGVF